MGESMTDNPELCPACGGQLEEAPPGLYIPAGAKWCPDCETLYTARVLEQMHVESQSLTNA